MKNSNDTIGDRTRDLPACSAVPQPTALPRAPKRIGRASVLYTFILENFWTKFGLKALFIIPSICENFLVFVEYFLLIFIGNFTTEILKILCLQTFVIYNDFTSYWVLS